MELLANLWTEATRNASPEALWYLDQLREYPVTTVGLSFIALCVGSSAVGHIMAWAIVPLIKRR
jgi:hypothetical protein